MVGDVHVLSQNELSEYEVGSAFRVKSLDPSALETRSQIIAATSQYLAKLYHAGHVSEHDVIKLFTKMSAHDSRV